jgi:hypothetical protein
MNARRSVTIAASVILVFAECSADQGEATVIRDVQRLKPAIETGGHTLPPPTARGCQLIDIPYSLIGALQTNVQWFPPFVLLPWSRFAPIDLTNRLRLDGRSVGNRSRVISPSQVVRQHWRRLPLQLNLTGQ